MVALETWLKKNELSQHQFAKLIGTRAAVVNRYILGQRTPDSSFMAKIFEATKGEVQPNDFYDLKYSKKFR